MQYLSFTLGDHFYAIPTVDIVTVLPLVRLVEVPLAPDYIAGLLRYRSAAHLVIDLSQLTHQRASKQLVSTRIVLVNCLLDDGQSVVLGLQLESAVNTINLDEEGWQENPYKAAEGQLVANIHCGHEHAYQRVTPRQLLNEQVLEILHANQ